MSKVKTIKEPKITAKNSFKGASGKEYFIEAPELLGIEPTPILS